jgi:hypothetical protein
MKLQPAVVRKDADGNPIPWWVLAVNSKEAPNVPASELADKLIADCESRRPAIVIERKKNSTVIWQDGIDTLLYAEKNKPGLSLELHQRLPVLVAIRDAAQGADAIRLAVLVDVIEMRNADLITKTEQAEKLLCRLEESIQKYRELAAGATDNQTVLTESRARDVATATVWALLTKSGVLPSIRSLVRWDCPDAMAMLEQFSADTLAERMLLCLEEGAPTGSVTAFYRFLIQHKSRPLIDALFPHREKIYQAVIRSFPQGLFEEKLQNVREVFEGKPRLRIANEVAELRLKLKDPAQSSVAMRRLVEHSHSEKAKTAKLLGLEINSAIKQLLSDPYCNRSGHPDLALLLLKCLSPHLRIEPEVLEGFRWSSSWPINRTEFNHDLEKLRRAVPKTKTKTPVTKTKRAAAKGRTEIR